MSSNAEKRVQIGEEAIVVAEMYKRAARSALDHTIEWEKALKNDNTKAVAEHRMQANNYEQEMKRLSERMAELTRQMTRLNAN